MAINITAQLLPTQKNFISDTQAGYPTFLGGYRSGKTHAGTFKMICNMVRNWGKNFLAIEPTHQLLKTVMIPKIESILIENKIKYNKNLSDMIIGTPFGKIYLRSGHNPESIIGFEVAGVWIDEPGVQKKETLDRASARMSSRDSKIKQIILTGTPEPGKQQNWWEEFAANPGVKLYRSSTREAIKYGVIDPEYINRLATIYSEKLLQAYIDGEFVNINEHLLFYEFRMDEHIKNAEFNSELPLLVSWDFNVNPLCVNIAQLIDGKLYFIDEIHLQNSDTRQAADQLLNKYPNAERFIIYGDASARARDTRGRSSDMDIILLKLVKSGKNFINRINTSNPSIRNTSNLVNGLLAPASKEPLLFLHSRCKNIAKDFLNVSGNKAEDERNGYGHHSDSVRYICEKIFGNRTLRKVA